MSLCYYFTHMMKQTNSIISIRYLGLPLRCHLHNKCHIPNVWTVRAESGENTSGRYVSVAWLLLPHLHFNNKYLQTWELNLEHYITGCEVGEMYGVSSPNGTVNNTRIFIAFCFHPTMFQRWALFVGMHPFHPLLANIPTQPHSQIHP